MMFERFTPEARAVVTHAGDHARALGHRYVGGEHVLLAAVCTGQPASAVLCAHGLTPARVEEEIVARAGLGAGAGLFGGLDRDALASIGIDIDTVRARIEASFGSQALSAASQAIYADAHRRRHYARWPAPMRRMRRGRRTRRALTSPPGPRPQAAGPAAPYQASGPRPGGHLPFTPIAKKILELAFREAVARHDSHVGVEHIALALASVKRGLVPSIMSAAGASEPALRGAILERYQQAS
jgi:ATP-dependent Clp protease ATP-binding subunit ClpA